MLSQGGNVSDRAVVELPGRMNLKSMSGKAGSCADYA